MKKTCRLLAIVVFLLGFAAASHAGPILNGSFEAPALSPGGWGLYAAIPGWTSTSYPIEIGWGTVYGVSGYDGNQVLELDSTGNAIVSQIVLTPGGSYVLSFLGAKRNGVLASTTKFDVYWNGGLVGNYSPTSTAMSFYAATVVAAASNTLEFRGAGTQDSYGALIDMVDLKSVPDGGITVLLLGVGFAGIGCFRRMVK